MSNPDDDDPFAAFFGAAKADPPVRPATKEQSSPALDLFVGMQQRQPPPAKPMADPFQAAMSAVPGGPRRSVDPFDFNNKAAASVAAFPLDPFREPIRSAIAPANSKSSPSADAFDPFEAISRSSSPIGVKPDPRSPVVEPATSLPGTRPAFPAPANDDEVSQLKAQVKVLQGLPAHPPDNVQPEMSTAAAVQISCGLRSRGRTRRRRWLGTPTQTITAAPAVSWNAPLLATIRACGPVGACSRRSNCWQPL